MIEGNNEEYNKGVNEIKKEKIKDEKTRVGKQGGKQERDHGVRNQAEEQLVK